MKCALVVGNSHYSDRILAQLHTPDADARALAEVLVNREIGGFDKVTPVLDGKQRDVNVAIDNFFKARRPGDLALLYFSGHGVLDNRGQLHLAAADTEVESLLATGIPAAYVIRCMDDCRAGKQILILDCCHSGAFAAGTTKGAEQKAVTAATFESEHGGSGRVVLTASNAMQSSWEGDRIIRQSELSLFTHFLLEGLRTGDADADQNGEITLNEWYNYAYDQVRARTPNQVPQIWTYRQQGDMVIARNPCAARPANVEKVADTTVQKERSKPKRETSVQKPADASTHKERPKEKREMAVQKPPKKAADAERSDSGGVKLLRTKFDNILVPLCDSCGAPLFGVLGHEYLQCNTCHKRFHDNFTCVEYKGKSVELPPKYGFLKQKPIGSVETCCKFCHTPLVRVQAPIPAPKTARLIGSTDSSTSKPAAQAGKGAVCAVCGEPVTPIRWGLISAVGELKGINSDGVCKTCGRKYHAKCAEQTKASLQWDGLTTQGRQQVSRPVYKCKVCHKPLEIYRG